MDGLTKEEARRRLDQYGPNVLPEKREFAAAAILSRQFTSPLIFILLAAMAIAIVLGDMVDAAVIGGAVALHTALGFLQEYKAESAIAALKSILTQRAKVIRDASPVVIPADELVPGDTVLLAHGDRVPADGKLVEASALFLNESVLTGESVPVEKRAGGDVCMGTVVASGRGKMEVTATGKETAIGRMAETIEETRKEETPLQREIGRLSRKLAALVLSLSGLLFLLGVRYGEGLLTMLTTAVAITVSAIPEGLAPSLTVILAVGMQRVMKRRALVRRMVAAETLGAVSVICMDKTGTITQGEMRVVNEALRLPDLAIRAAVLANNLEDPLEVAIWDWAKTKDHTDPQSIIDRSPRVSEEPFDSVKKYMSVTTSDGTWLKGAPEAILAMCRATAREKRAWMSTVHAWGNEGLRVVALGHNMTFLGLLGISDPVRQGVREAVADVREAGVGVTMVTGDYRATAEAVLRHIGMPITHPDRQIMEGSELAAIGEAQLARRIRDIRLFCRVSPDQKYKIVSVYQSAGEVVAMTGDGVNDATAIKRADIGIVVAGASDVSRQTADVVLLESTFRTIVAAIEEGRAIFDNIRKVTFYLLSNAFVEITLITGAIIAGLPLPLTAIQILWMNLVDDGFPALALAVDPKSHDLMRRRPRPKRAPLVDRKMAMGIGIMSVATATVAVPLFFLAGGVGDLGMSRTVTFTFVAVDSLFYAFVCRVVDRPLRLSSLFQNRWLVIAVGAGALLQLFAVYHPWGNHAFGTVPLPWSAWGIIGGASLATVGMIEGVKRLL